MYELAFANLVRSSEFAPRGNSLFFVQTFQRTDAVNSLRQLGQRIFCALFSSRSL